MLPKDQTESLTVGRYELFDEIATGGMGTVHLGRLKGAAGFARIVAIKRLHKHYSKDPEFVSMFLDEARLAARVQHVNVVATLDVVAQDGELFLVMEYVRGESLSRLLRAARSRGEQVPPAIVSAILCNVLMGLHAAHEATNERGASLEIVHRDVSPQNVLVGIDGVSRVLDFGIAKAKSRIQTTRDGQIKGKLAYMSPEQLLRRRVDRRADVFAAGVVCWEALTGRRLFAAEDSGAVIASILDSEITPPSQLATGLDEEVDAVVLQALQRSADRRLATAQEMAAALRAALPPADSATVGEWVVAKVGDLLEVRSQRLVEIESESVPPPGMKAPSPMAQPATLTDLSATGESSAGPSARPSRRVALLLVALALVAVVAVLAFVGIERGKATAASTASNSAALPEAKPSSTPSATPATAAPAESDAASPTASAEPSAAEPTHIAPSRHSPPRKAITKPKAAAAKPDCSPPYRLDSNGRKRFKPECF